MPTAPRRPSSGSTCSTNAADSPCTDRGTKQSGAELGTTEPYRAASRTARSDHRSIQYPEGIGSAAPSRSPARAEAPHRTEPQRPAASNRRGAARRAESGAARADAGRGRAAQRRAWARSVPEVPRAERRPAEPPPAPSRGAAAGPAAPTWRVELGQLAGPGVLRSPAPAAALGLFRGLAGRPRRLLPRREALHGTAARLRAPGRRLLLLCTDGRRRGAPRARRGARRQRCGPRQHREMGPGRGVGGEGGGRRGGEGRGRRARLGTPPPPRDLRANGKRRSARRGQWRGGRGGDASGSVPGAHLATGARGAARRCRRPRVLTSSCPAALLPAAPRPSRARRPRRPSPRPHVGSVRAAEPGRGSRAATGRPPRGDSARA